MSASLAPECNEVKERYDNCFLKWYSEKFLRGTATTDECDPLFKQYEKCLSVREPISLVRPTHHHQKVLKERGIDKMVKEAREDNRENDAEHMKPVSVPSSPS
ncbi:Mitochondrial distribution and morphology protein 35 [Didymosphaeria variabile]|uniref:Mitochondrial distribution and morphology protein 35 n=1 Tax=Didymosphaeria variabile TaxID=1932322 RepID=A0A9W9C7Z5_9PLEO|nr:Mitochondrial distribution and morphology protein 35 [Didymosphaeria variabile]KAJ4348420.1 Mitochondrial distribution and morphology protein 35 [Didymosphaeria variabile]